MTNSSPGQWQLPLLEAIPHPIPREVHTSVSGQQVGHRFKRGRSTDKRVCSGGDKAHEREAQVDKKIPEIMLICSIP